MISSVAGLTANCTFGAARLDADGADHRDRLVAQQLVLAVGQRLLRRDRSPESPGVDAHRVDVLDRADDDDVVAASRMTSSSNSPQPSTDSSMSILADRRGGEALPRCSSSSASARAMPPPRPPSVNAGG
jgi:hypothetical protein